MIVEGLSWDEQAEEHIHRHAVTPEEVEQAIENIQYARKEGGYFLLVAQTYGGRYLTLILDHLGNGIWYPVTARDAEEPEKRLARRSKR